MSGWMVVALSAVSLGSAAAPVARSPAPPPPTHAAVQLAQNYSQPYGAQTYSAPQNSTWATYKVRLAALARLQGVRQSTIDANVPGLAVNQRVIELERTEPVAQTYGGYIGALAPYLRTHVTSSLISRGRANYADHYRGLSAIEARYGVDPAVLMSIWGMETSYGTVTGSTDLLSALASLGYYGRRRDFFESEFIAALKLIDQGVPRWRLKGSWAGAT
ncbi:MAG TPA: lytic murein transglycosylase, partial [Sphingomicrobium sp.]